MAAGANPESVERATPRKSWTRRVAVSAGLVVLLVAGISVVVVSGIGPRASVGDLSAAVRELESWSYDEDCGGRLDARVDWLRGQLVVVGGPANVIFTEEDRLDDVPIPPAEIEARLEGRLQESGTSVPVRWRSDVYFVGACNPAF